MKDLKPPNGYCTLWRNLSLVGVEKNSIWPKFGKGEETSVHFLAEYKAYERLRLKTFQKITLLREELRTIAWANALKQWIPSKMQD